MLNALFISHGSPALIMSDHPARAFLSNLGRRLTRPRGALVVSAHFETPTLTLGADALPGTWHDFYGFPRALYEVRYPAQGMPSEARKLAEALQTQGYKVRLDPVRPLDHGIWSPLSLLWPEADVPLVPVSVPMGLTTHEQLSLAAALGRYATANDVWLIGSGAATHNLGDRKPEFAPPDPWASEFTAWAKEVAYRGDLAALADWRHQAPYANHAHPTPEHFLPLLMCVAAMNGRPMAALHDSFSYGNLSMLTLASPQLAEQWQTAA